MRTKLIPIGNSKGIRIPKALLQQFGLEDEIDLDFENDSLVIRPAREARRGWEEAFKKMRRRGDDALLDRESESSTDWDRKEWTW